MIGDGVPWKAEQSSACRVWEKTACAFQYALEEGSDVATMSFS